ncbi:MAG: Gldg family protein [Planctomycetes bacterium]|nr:Gldg family protein [Planctomycetota bacterium]
MSISSAAAAGASAPSLGQPQGWSIVRAIAKRDARSWFGNPAGYVFVTIFVVLCALFLFSDAFFQNNAASLDSLNAVFPMLLVVLIPAITMSIWAAERASGTEELLLTLPASDLHIVLGKYLAAAAIYTTTLAFTVPQVALLWLLGNPDGFLVVSNYLGYWLLGLALIGAGMIGSQLSANLTVSFILGAVLCGGVVYAEQLFGLIFPADLIRAWLLNFPVALFGEMSRGLVSISALVLYGGMIAAFLYFNLLLLSRRHWRGGEPVHLSLRFVALGAAALGATFLMSNLGGKIDATSEGIHSLSEQTLAILDGLDPERPVNVEAFLSPEVPNEFVAVRRDVENLLRRYESKSGGKVRVRLVECERYSEEARSAEQKYGIQAAEIYGDEGGAPKQFWVYLGLAVTCGAEENVIPFLSNRLSVEYEITRSIRSVAQTKRRKLGVLKTDLDLMGGFDMQAMRSLPPWQIVRDLKLQYEVIQVDPEKDYPADLDVLLAPLANTLPQAQLERFGAYIKAGNPVVWLDDPLPVSSMGNGANDQRRSKNQNPMFGGGQDQPEPKGDFTGLLNELGIRWPMTNVVWDVYNPHPQFEDRMSPAIVFVGKDSRGRMPFNGEEAISSGLQEMALLWAGEVESSGVSGLQWKPLLGSSATSGTTSFQSFQRPNMFGMPEFDPNPPIRRTIRADRAMACRVRGKLKPEDSKPIDLVFVADVDMISNEFYSLRGGQGSPFNFDNITFALNAIDELAGDRSFVELRKRRPLQRTLSTIEERTEVSKQAWIQEKEKAEDAAKEALDKAQASLDAAVKKIQESTELDEESKAIQIRSVQEVEQRRLDLAKAQINDAKERKVEEANAKRHLEQREIRDFYTWLGIGISPVLSVLVGFLVFISKRAREREAIPAARLKGGVA